jgi:hypothetical protein
MVIFCLVFFQLAMYPIDYLAARNIGNQNIAMNAEQTCSAKYRTNKQSPAGRNFIRFDDIPITTKKNASMMSPQLCLSTGRETTRLFALTKKCQSKDTSTSNGMEERAIRRSTFIKMFDYALFIARFKI